jgi:hypothetical protein
MGHVILEGPDGAGKTTLARNICARYQLAYHHEGPPPSGTNVLHHYARLLLETKQPTVFDRFHIGETIYGPLLRGGSALSPRDMTLMDRLIIGLGVTVIICLPPWETCLANNQDRHELIKEDNLRRVAYECWHATIYDHRRHYPISNLMLYDYQKEKTFGSLVRWPAPPDGVIGPFHADTLIVGEQPNGTLDLPFFGKGNSSEFLHDCLEEAGVTHYAMTNAVDAGSKARNLGRIASDMPALRRVVLLGKVAEGVWQRTSAAVKDRELTVATLAHPQYWKRFKLARRDEYVAALKEACNAATA